jgi:hypothetical protein
MTRGDDGRLVSLLESNLVLRAFNSLPNETAYRRAAAAYESGGRKAMMASLVAHEIAQFEQNGESALRVAMFEAATGDANAVVRWLERADSINEPESGEIAAYVEFIPYRERNKDSRHCRHLYPDLALCPRHSPSLSHRPAKL